MESSRTLSEEASKSFLGAHGVRFARDELVTAAAEAGDAADRMGYPVVAKLCGDEIAHKTERGLVRLGLSDRAAVELAAQELFDCARPEDEVTGVLVAEQVAGDRELIAGLNLDPQFGMTVMVGVGGILAEAVADVSIRMVPLSRTDAHDMIDGLATTALLGEFRGAPAVDRSKLVDVIMALASAAEAEPTLVSADLNPLIICDGEPIAVDALVELAASVGAVS